MNQCSLTISGNCVEFLVKFFELLSVIETNETRPNRALMGRHLESVCSCICFMSPDLMIWPWLAWPIRNLFSLPPTTRIWGFLSFRLSAETKQESRWNQCESMCILYCARFFSPNNISKNRWNRKRNLRRGDENMLVKQYASLLTFVYFFKWNRQMNVMVL